MPGNKDILVAHEYFPQRGGGEYVATKMLEMYPEADLATTYWDPRKWGGSIVDDRLVQSTVPFWKAALAKTLPLSVVTTAISRIQLPEAAESINTEGYDTIISSGAWTKGVITNPDQTHIAYIHTPVRFCHDLYHYNLDKKGIISSKIFKYVSRKIRAWEHVSSKRPDVLIANSTNTKKRINKYYNRDAVVINPPVEIEKYKEAATNYDTGDFYFTMSRLWREKKVVEICEAFSKYLTNEKLVVAGTGPQKRKIQRYARHNDNIEYRGFVTEEEKLLLYSTAKAFIFNAVDEDFGLTPIEANAAGTPVISIGEGGVLESQTRDIATFFDNHSAESVAEGVVKHYKKATEEELIKNAERFSVDRFEKELREVINNV